MQLLHRLPMADPAVCIGIDHFGDGLRLSGHVSARPHWALLLPTPLRRVDSILRVLAGNSIGIIGLLRRASIARKISLRGSTSASSCSSPRPFLSAVVAVYGRRFPPKKGRRPAT